MKKKLSGQKLLLTMRKRPNQIQRTLTENTSTPLPTRKIREGLIESSLGRWLKKYAIFDFKKNSLINYYNL